MTATPDDLMRIGATAATLGMSTTWFRHHWRRLVREHHFPAPLPHSTHPLFWTRAAIERWKNPAAAPTTAAEPANQNDDWEAIMANRIAAMDDDDQAGVS